MSRINTLDGSKARLDVLKTVLINISAWIIVLVFFFPIFYMVSSAFKTVPQTFAYPPVWFFKPVLDNFKAAIQDLHVFSYMSNSIIVATLSSIICIIVAFPASYGLARFQFRGRDGVAYSFLAMQSIPTISIVIAFFFIARSMSLLDTRRLLVLSYLYWNIPYAVWQLRGFILTVPAEIEEAALVDGCNRFLIPFKITLPLVVQGIVATFIFLFITSWNEYVFAFFLTFTDAKTLPIMTSLFMTHTEILWGPMFATATLAMAPVVVFVLLVRKYFISALTYGAIK